MACVGVTLANRAAAPKWKNLRRLWSKRSSVMTHLQILGRARGIDAEHSRHRRRPQGIYGHQFGVSVPAQRLREWVSAARPLRTPQEVLHIVYLTDRQGATSGASCRALHQEYRPWANCS